MEPQSREGLGVAIEKLRRLAAKHAVERGHALLAVEQQLHHAGGQWTISAMRGTSGFGGPYKKPAHGVPTVEGIKKSAHLLAIPDVAALELGQCHVPVVDVVEDGGYFHGKMKL